MGIASLSFQENFVRPGRVVMVTDNLAEAMSSDE
jgi:hypothetical protein